MGGTMSARAPAAILAAILAAASAVAAPLSCAAAPAADPAADQAGAYARWRPLLSAALAEGGGPEDLYKLLHQAIMGPAHAAVDSAAALAALRAEWAEVAARRPDAPAAEPLWESIRPDGALLRVHLRPLAARAVGAAARDSLLAELAGAFARTAAIWRGDLPLLARLWAEAIADSALWRGAALPDETTAAGARAAASRLGEQAAAAGWPAVRHSAAYRARRDPHYRVVGRGQLPAAWRGQEAP